MNLDDFLKPVEGAGPPRTPFLEEALENLTDPAAHAEFVSRVDQARLISFIGPDEPYMDRRELPDYTHLTPRVLREGHYWIEASRHCGCVDGVLAVVVGDEAHCVVTGRAPPECSPVMWHFLNYVVIVKLAGNRGQVAIDHGPPQSQFELWLCLLTRRMLGCAAQRLATLA